MSDNGRNGSWKVPLMTFLAGLVVAMTVTYFREGVTKADLENSAPWARDKSGIVAEINRNAEDIDSLQVQHSQTLRELSKASRELGEINVRLQQLTK